MKKLYLIFSLLAIVLVVFSFTLVEDQTMQERNIRMGKTLLPLHFIMTGKSFTECHKQHAAMGRFIYSIISLADLERTLC